MAVRVFLVDDVPKTQSMLAGLPANLGDFRVVGSAGTEAEANLWRDENVSAWDLAIIDLLLEQGAGLSVIGRCCAQSRRSTVIVFSGYATPGVRACGRAGVRACERRRCIELGANAVFDKMDLEGLPDFCMGSAGYTNIE